MLSFSPRLQFIYNILVSVYTFLNNISKHRIKSSQIDLEIKAQEYRLQPIEIQVFIALHYIHIFEKRR